MERRTFLPYTGNTRRVRTRHSTSVLTSAERRYYLTNHTPLTFPARSLRGMKGITAGLKRCRRLLTGHSKVSERVPSFLEAEPTSSGHWRYLKRQRCRRQPARIQKTRRRRNRKLTGKNTPNIGAIRTSWPTRRCGITVGRSWWGAR